MEFCRSSEDCDKIFFVRKYGRACVRSIEVAGAIVCRKNAPDFVYVSTVGFRRCQGSNDMLTCLSIVDLPEDSRYARVVLFQESILTRFGFMQLQENVQRTNMHVQSREYVHCSGGMFVMLPARDNKNELDRSVERGDCHTPSSRAEIGFWWAWNSCLTKKWRSSYTGNVHRVVLNK